MEPFGASRDEVRGANPLKEMVGKRRLELLTSTVSNIQRHWQPALALQGTLKNCYWTLIGARCRHLSHATLRAFVAVFRAVRGFFRDAAAGFFVFGAPLTEDGDSSLGCFPVR